MNISRLQILNTFSQDQRRRSRPYKKRKKGTETYQSPKVKMALMESLRDKFIQDSQEPKLKAGAAQKPLPPLAKERESARQDLFNNTQLKMPQTYNPQTTVTPTTLAQFLHNKQLQQHQQSGAMAPDGSAPAKHQLNGAPVPAADQSFGLSDAPNMRIPFGLNSPFPSNCSNNGMLGQQMQVARPLETPPPSMDTSSAGQQVTSQQQMEQHVRQHILKAQLQLHNQQQLQQQMPQPPTSQQQQPVKQQQRAVQQQEIQQQQQQLVQQAPSQPQQLSHQQMAQQQQFSLQLQQQSPSQQSQQQPTSTFPAQTAPFPASGSSNLPTAAASGVAGVTGSKPKERPDADLLDKLVEGGEKLNPPKPRPPSPEYDDPDCQEVHEDNTHLFKVRHSLILPGIGAGSSRCQDSCIQDNTG